MEEALAQPMPYIVPRPRGINHVVFAPEGNLVATSDVDLNVHVRRGDEVVFVRNFRTPNLKARNLGRVRGLAFDPSGTVVSVAAGDRLYAVDWETGNEIWHYVSPKSFGFLVISPLAMTADRVGRVVASFDNGMIGVWSRDGELAVKWRDNDLPRSMAAISDGRLVGADGFAICVWDLESGKKLYRRPVRDKVFGMASDGGGYIVTRSWRSATLWNLNQNEEVLTLPVSAGLPLVALSQKSQRIALGDERSVQILDYEGRLRNQIHLEDARVLSLTFSPRTDELAVGDSDGKLRLMDTKVDVD